MAQLKAIRYSCLNISFKTNYICLFVFKIKYTAIEKVFKKVTLFALMVKSSVTARN